MIRKTVLIEIGYSFNPFRIIHLLVICLLLAVEYATFDCLHFRLFKCNNSTLQWSTISISFCSLLIPNACLHRQQLMRTVKLTEIWKGNCLVSNFDTLQLCRSAFVLILWQQWKVCFVVFKNSLASAKGCKEVFIRSVIDARVS